MKLYTSTELAQIIVPYHINIEEILTEISVIILAMEDIFTGMVLVLELVSILY